MGLGKYAGNWQGVDDYDDYGNSDSRGRGNSDGGMSDAEKLYKFRFSVPEPKPDLLKYSKKKPNLVNPGQAATKRVLFLSGGPYCIYEHGLWQVNRAFDVMGAFTATCLLKNQLHESCSLCKNKRYPYFIGFFSIIDMGQVEYINRKVKLYHEYWEDRDGNRHYRRFQNCLLGAKRGSQDKPGVLKTLHHEMNQLRNQHGWEDLSGTVWDTTRLGKKSAAIGDSWRFVRRLESSEIEDYLVTFGAKKDEINSAIPVLDINAPGTALYVDPESYAKKVDSLFFSGGVQSRSGNSDTRRPAQSAGAGFTGDDEDIPF